MAIRQSGGKCSCGKGRDWEIGRKWEEKGERGFWEDEEEEDEAFWKEEKRMMMR
jgi:hypothetical protein